MHANSYDRSGKGDQCDLVFLFLVESFSYYQGASPKQKGNDSKQEEKKKGNVESMIGRSMKRKSNQEKKQPSLSA